MKKLIGILIILFCATILFANDTAQKIKDNNVCIKVLSDPASEKWGGIIIICINNQKWMFLPTGQVIPLKKIIDGKEEFEKCNCEEEL
jgi:hypothetical protein